MKQITLASGDLAAPAVDPHTTTRSWCWASSSSGPSDKIALRPPDPQQLREDIRELVGLIEDRPGVLQASRSVTACSTTSAASWRSTRLRPSTFIMAQVALRVGRFQAMHSKHEFGVPRPTYLAPALLPPIDPPGHASCSSAHATDPGFWRASLKEVMPAEAHAALDRMAERSARNREVVGVPDPSDSEALATETFPLLDAGPVFRALETTAKAEWADDRAD